MEKTVVLTEGELMWCKNHAMEVVEYYGGNNTLGSGQYNHNKISSNMVGVKSEVATAKWFRENVKNPKIEENYKRYRSNGLKGDIVCNRKVIEVKGLRPHQWQKFRRMVPPKQLRHCVRNRAIIVWTLAKGNSQDSKVKLMGWNYAHEVENHGVEVRTICDNIWLQDEELMRPMDTLIDVLN